MRARLVELLDLLSTPTTETVKSLAAQLNVTTKTVRNEIKEINELLASSGFQKFVINRGTVEGSLTATQRHQFTDKFINTDPLDDYLNPQQRIMFLLLEFLSAKEPLFIVDLQAKMLISKSTMDSDMRDLRKVVQSYGLRITTDPRHGVNVVGNERAIRMMFVDMLTHQPSVLSLFYEKLGNPEILVDEAKHVFSIEAIDFVREQLRKHFSKSALARNDNYQRQATLITLVWLTRVRNGHYVDDSSDSEPTNLSSRQSEFVSAIISSFQLELETTSEIDYLAFSVGSFDSEESTELDQWAKSQIISSALIEWMEESLGFPFSKSESLFERVYKHISALLRRQNQNINAYNPLKSTIMQSYPKIFNAVQSFFSKKQSEYQIVLSEDEVGYLAIYFSTAQVEIRQERVYTYRIAVVCNYGMATGRLLAAKLEEHFNVDVIAVLSISELSVLKKLPVSLVFTTIDVDIDGIPSVKINPIPSERDLEIAGKFLADHSKLSRYEGEQLEPTRLFNNILTLLKNSNIRVEKNLVFDLQRVFEANQLEINEREVQPMLKDLVSDSQIQLQQSADDWETTIEIAARPLLNEDYIDQHYVQAMVDSVKKYGPYIVIGPSIALAHARPEDGAQKLGVTITTLKTPVNFGNPENDPVKIVFCLAAVDNYSHLNVMRSIVQLINDPDKVNQLSKISDITTFRSVLFDSAQLKGTN
jgi:mannitol operon transcriptional antiterminator